MNLNRFRARPWLVLVILSLASAASAEWKEKVLYSFQGLPDGSSPVGAVVFDKAGNLYGATRNGGSSSCPSVQQCGTVYQLAPPAKQGGPWTETVLYIFKGNTSNDGASPYGGLVIDAAGNLYGTTGYGGTGNCTVLGSKLGCGTVFELSPPKQKGGPWTETVLYSFPTPKQGFVPWGDLVFDGAGNLYGATIYGGGYGTNCGDAYYQYCGAVFELSPPKTKGGQWTEKTLHGFKGNTDGANPNGGLVLDSKGNVYGTTYLGGTQSAQCGSVGCGTAFELRPPAKRGGGWTENVLHRFYYNTLDASNPMAGLVFDLRGNLYGTSLRGGPGPGGTVFRLSPSSKKRGTWTETTLHGFNGNEGGYDPEGALIFDASGNLYSTTNVGRGGSLRGNVFQLKPPSGKGRDWTLSTIHGFTGIPDGENPTGSLTSDKASNLYSTTQYGGSGSGCSFTGCGVVFEVLP
jgi:uncharacterized repeat protein (TIGR03803 family)